MTVDDAAALVALAVTPSVAPARLGATLRATPHWADLGAGRGTFTLALARLLGPSARVDAVDRDAAAAESLGRLRREPDAARVAAHRADFADPAALNALQLAGLDGALLANALHFVVAPRQPAVVADLAARLAVGGRLVVVEYEARAPSRWVPAPVPLARLGALVDAANAANAAGLRVTAPVRVGTYPSAFGGTMYAAYVERTA